MKKLIGKVAVVSVLCLSLLGSGMGLYANVTGVGGAPVDVYQSAEEIPWLWGM